MVDVRTLYLRNVPDDVAATLERLAAEEGMSLNAYAVSRLTAVAMQRRNAEVLKNMPNLKLTPEDREEIVRSIRAFRDGLDAFDE